MPTRSASGDRSARRRLRFWVGMSRITSGRAKHSAGDSCRGIDLYCNRIFPLRDFLGSGLAVTSATGRRRMNETIYVIGGAISALLFVYLIVALLKPEWFA